MMPTKRVVRRVYRVVAPEGICVDGQPVAAGALVMIDEEAAAGLLAEGAVRGVRRPGDPL